ncbi:MAG TPA: methyltransferase domain-containing protein [Polyangia bacterium]|jgi:SAM-dependent methyltransferase|nr:methyltransferase domain-containing protein [Polyangia bacterium]
MTDLHADTQTKHVFNRRLPLYVYLEPLLAGRRVLELGSGAGAGAAHLAAHGAATVLGVETDAALVEKARARHAAPNLSFRAVTNLLDVIRVGPFDVVVVPEAETLLRRPEAIPALGRLLAEGGRLILAASSADRGVNAAGVGYYELADALVPHFAAVQMFGITPFAGFGVVEFEVDGDGLRVDSRLVEGGAEPASAYVAVAGRERAAELGYALVQVPFAPLEAKLTALAEGEDRGAARVEFKEDKTDVRTDARVDAAERRLDEVERRGRVRVDELEARAGELRRKLEDASVQSESAVRIARAQGEEMEELRGRLRRAAEDRAALDGELAKLRRALADADESVMTLTRRTAEEMSAVAQRLAESLRAPAPAPREDTTRLRQEISEAEGRASAAEQRLEEVAAVGRERQAALDDVLERLKQAEESTARERREIEKLRAQVREAGGQARTLDERESTIVRRDERIAKLEGEKQELVWRLAEFEEKLRQTIGRAVISDSTGRVQADELESARGARARALEEFHKAAGAHVDEVTALRASVAEQSALVSELEDAVRSADGAAAAATADAATLRKNAKALEEADRTRRTRLAELEGKLLRLEHEKKQATSAPAPAQTLDMSSLERRAEDLTRERDQAANARDQSAHERDAIARERDELRQNLARLMGAAAQTTEALAKATDELGASRARATSLDAEVTRLRAAKPAAANGHDGAASATARELAAIEAGLRDELASISKIERALADELANANVPAVRSSEDQGAEAILLHTTLANYRRHASRLRDELEGVRRRLDSLSPSEISGYLEELGEDLAEMEE